ncbi:uncharacterized protein F4807DRAFT_464784 [Annulohypoxylon truncatum]|uniref:uncharacterized protein n=1 Tax=Annulohypoxylon truncatum TaxID=327061 RepID=UPI002008A6D2|nr:uncharacterized protein F4807DRAFT_464784 [Annulohypoxylon truncatum]KAI1205305.1 hypothetical protein F4807DRAFT_464784 [Annulohypoxylon truncatum]
MSSGVVNLEESESGTYTFWALITTLSVAGLGFFSFVLHYYVGYKRRKLEKKTQNVDVEMQTVPSQGQDSATPGPNLPAPNLGISGPDLPAQPEPTYRRKEDEPAHEPRSQRRMALVDPSELEDVDLNE